MISDNLPVLPVVLPILAAPLCVILHRPRLAWPLAVLVAWLTFWASCALLARVLEFGTISYHVGNWAPPFGIEFRIDTLNAWLMPLVSGIGALVLTYAPRSLAAEVPPSRHGLLYAVYLLALTGLLGMTVTGDAFNVFVFLEISSLSTYALVSMGPDRRALVAGFRYLIMGAIGGTFFLIGVGLLYMKTGTLNMADLAERLPALRDSRTVLAGLGFLATGLSLKIALFPLHLWLPNAYTYAPSAVTAFLAATATKVSVYIVLRFFFTILGVGESLGNDAVREAIMTLALVGIFAASLVACFQDDVKRALAYSSVAQIGYILVGITMLSVDGLTGALVHMFNHALMKGGLFMVLGCVVLRVGGSQLADLRGIGRRMPLTAFAFVIGGLGMIGVPTTVGFVSKWYLILGALRSDLWHVAALMLASSLLAVVYVWRVVEVMYFQEPVDAPEIDEAKTEEAPPVMLLTTLTMIGATIWFGLNTDLTVGIARRTAEMLLGGGA